MTPQDPVQEALDRPAKAITLDMSKPNDKDIRQVLKDRFVLAEEVLRLREELTFEKTQYEGLLKRHRENLEELKK